MATNKIIVVNEERQALVVKSGRGPQGPAGRSAVPGQPRWNGHGPPTVIIGAQANDLYIDLDTGTLYRLD